MGSSIRFIEKKCQCGKSITWRPIEGGYYTSDAKAMRAAFRVFADHGWVADDKSAMCPECQSTGKCSLCGREKLKPDEMMVMQPICKECY